MDESSCPMFIGCDGRTAKNCGQPRDPIVTTTMDTFSPPLSFATKTPCAPSPITLMRSPRRRQNGQIWPARETRTLRVLAMQQIDCCQPPQIASVPPIFQLPYPPPLRKPSNRTMPIAIASEPPQAAHPRLGGCLQPHCRR